MGAVDGSIADVDSAGARLVVRADQRKRSQRGSGLMWELLTPDVDGRIEFLRGELEPGASAPSELGAYVSHEGEENVHCLEGSVTMLIGGDEFSLEAGDSIQFDCSRPHRAENRGDNLAILIVAITPPTF